MEHLSLKLESGMSRQIEKDMKEFRYSTKTEFVREAIREKLKANQEERRKKGWEALFAARGILKGKVKPLTDEEFRRARLEAAEEYLRELDEKFNIK